MTVKIFPLREQYNKLTLRVHSKVFTLGHMPICSHFFGDRSETGKLMTWVERGVKVGVCVCVVRPDALMGLGRGGLLL